MKIRNRMLSSIIVMVLLCQMPIAQSVQDYSEAFPTVSSIEIEDLTGKTHDEIKKAFNDFYSMVYVDAETGEIINVVTSDIDTRG